MDAAGAASSGWTRRVRRRNFIQPTSSRYTTVTGAQVRLRRLRARARQARSRWPATRAARRAGSAARADGTSTSASASRPTSRSAASRRPRAGVARLGAGGWETATVRVHPTGKVHGRSPALAARPGPRDVLVADRGRRARRPSTTSTCSTATPRSRPSGSAPTARARSPSAASRSDTRCRQGADKAQGSRRTCSRRRRGPRVRRRHVLASRARPTRRRRSARSPWRRDRAQPARRHGAGLEATTFFDPPNFIFPFGTHIGVVEVDERDRQVDALRYVAVDDCGNVINPMIVDGQVHGGVAQGVGPGAVRGGRLRRRRPAAHRHARWTTRADAPPSCRRFELDRTVTPIATNPLGVKGIGEAGTIGVDARRRQRRDATR